MGRRGPPPTPTALLKKLGMRSHGTLKQGREPKPLEPRLDGEVPPALESDQYAVECWRKYYPMLNKMRVLSESDLLGLQGLCMSYARARAADMEVQLNGLLITGAWGRKVTNPAVVISRNAWTEVRKFVQEYGMTPAARARVREIEGEESAPQGRDQKAAQTPEEFIFRTGTTGKVAGRIGPSR